MAVVSPQTAPVERPRSIERYYRLHARIYDATRWSFLFGREAILQEVAKVRAAPANILEVGCGTGRNLAACARRFPQARLTGVDLSGEMLAIARRRTSALGSRVRLLQQSYAVPLGNAPEYDLVLCSYALSMFNPGFEAAVAAARHDLAPGGVFALVDFHATRFPWFARWMAVNHVRMQGQLRPRLEQTFAPLKNELRPAYAGTWQYLLFVGRRTG